MLKFYRRISKFKNYKLYSSVTPISPAVPPTKISLLPNCIKVATEENENASLACISLFIQTGPRYENDVNNGMTYFIEHMAFKGFQSMNKNDLLNKLLNLGAKMTAHTGREMQIFSALCPSDTACHIVDILSKIIMDLELSCEEIEREKRNIYMRSRKADNNPKNVLFDYLHQTAFQGTNLAQSVLGTTASIQNFSRSNIINFMFSQYQPFRLVLAASGNFCHEQIVDHAMARLGCLVQTDCIPDVCPCRFTGSEVMFRDDSLPYAHIAVAFEAPGLNSPDYLTLLVASHIIGSWDKSQGGLMNNAWHLARAGSVEGLCESYKSFYIAYQDVGLWGVYFVSKKMEVDDMMYNVNKVWMNLVHMTVHTELDKAIHCAKLALSKMVTGSRNSCYDLGMQMMYSECRKSLPEFYDDLSHITVNKVKAVTDKYLYDRCPAVAGVGPTEAMPEYNRLRAGTYWIRN